MIGSRLVTRGLGGKAMVIGGLAEPGTYKPPVALRWDMGTLHVLQGGGTLHVLQGGGTLPVNYGSLYSE